MNKKFYSNGKLLITGEYLVLDGTKAFALPTKMGQDLIVTETNETNSISWKSFDYDQSIWFESTLLISTIINQKFKEEEEGVAKVLQNILFEAHLLNPNVLTNKSFSIETNLTFPRFWGLGTSSTLINNVAQWFEINAFELLKNSFGGSGYDIACAQNNSPIIYSLLQGIPTVEVVDFNPNFAANIYFLYLNQKQNSKASIASYYDKQCNTEETKVKINSITNRISLSENQEEFASLIEQHEVLMSEVLQTKTVKERYFADFKGTIKSLGAWGGDFVLVISDENPKEYFANKGFSTLIPYHEMIL